MMSESPFVFPTVQCRDLWRKECRITHPLGRGAECGALSHKIFWRLENIRVSGSMNRLTGSSGRRDERRGRREEGGGGGKHGGFLRRRQLPDGGWALAQFPLSFFVSSPDALAIH